MAPGAAPDLAAADAIVRSKTLQLRSGDEVNAACTFGGVITSATPVFEVENRTAGVRGFAAINEGRGAALRYGSTAPETLQRVRWLNGEFAEVIGTAIRSTGGIDVFAIINQALAMGDELHSRQKASSALFLGTIAPAVCDVAGSSAQASRVLAFLASNDFFFLPVAMASAKSAMVATQGIRHSSIVTAIAFNGARCGIRVSGLAGWSTAPVPIVSGHLFKGFSERDAGPVIGDSEIMETMGLGAFAMAGAPALAQYVGGTADSDRVLPRRCTASLQPSIPHSRCRI